jgi:hypothetical protein
LYADIDEHASCLLKAGLGHCCEDRAADGVGCVSFPIPVGCFGMPARYGDRKADGNGGERLFASHSGCDLRDHEVHKLLGFAEGSFVNHGVLTPHDAPCKCFSNQLPPFRETFLNP